MNVGDVVEVKASGRYERAELLDTTDPKRWLVRLERNGKRQGAYPHHVREIARRGLPVPSENVADRGPDDPRSVGFMVREAVAGLGGFPREPIVEQPKTNLPRSEAFLDLVRSRPCPCGAVVAIEPHHFTTGGMGLKGSDYFVAPQCPPCHRADVRDGNRRCFAGMTHAESMVVLWKAAAECLALFVEGARRKR